MLRIKPVLLSTGVILMTTIFCRPVESIEMKRGHRPEPQITAPKRQPATMEAILPSGDVIIVAEGTDEPVNSGSYSIRLYSVSNGHSPPDHFAGGQIRPRSGFVDSIVIDDLNRNGKYEVIVIIRNTEGEPYISADAYAIAGDYLKFIGTFPDLSATTEAVAQIKKSFTKNIENSSQYSGVQCERIHKMQSIILPEKEQTVSIKQIKKICNIYGAAELLQKIERDPPGRPFRSDGCSLWFGAWNGVSLYPACFIHDLKYWAGYPDEEMERLMADTDLMIDIACLTGSTGMAETMFQGTRIGGDELYQRPFSWGFGRNQK